MASDTTRYLSTPTQHYPWRPCLTCGQRTRRVDQICIDHPRNRDKACEQCGRVMADARPNKQFCRECLAERARLSARRSRVATLNPDAPPRPQPNHPCLRCGINVPTRAARCVPCTAAHKAEILRIRRRTAHPRTAQPAKPLTVAIPCARCKHGRASSVSDSGWECGLMMAGRCKPWGSASLMEKRYD